MRQVVADEGLNEVIAVVVTILHAQLQRLSDALAGLLKQLRTKLLGEKLILAALVDQNAFGISHGSAAAGRCWGAYRAVVAA